MLWGILHVGFSLTNQKIILSSSCSWAFCLTWRRSGCSRSSSRLFFNCCSFRSTSLSSSLRSRTTFCTSHFRTRRSLWCNCSSSWWTGSRLHSRFSSSSRCIHRATSRLWVVTSWCNSSRFRVVTSWCNCSRFRIVTSRTYRAIITSRTFCIYRSILILF